MNISPSIGNKQMIYDLNTPVGLLTHLLAVNEHGVWFVEIQGSYAVLPRWIYGHCQRVIPNPRIIGQAQIVREPWSE